MMMKNHGHIELELCDAVLPKIWEYRRKLNMQIRFVYVAS